MRAKAEPLAAPRAPEVAENAYQELEAELRDLAGQLEQQRQEVHSSRQQLGFAKQQSVQQALERQSIAAKADAANELLLAKDAELGKARAELALACADSVAAHKQSAQSS